MDNFMTREDYRNLYELLGKLQIDNKIQDVDLNRAKDRDELLKMLAMKQVYNAINLVKNVAVYDL